MQESPPHKRFLAECFSPFMRLAEHLTGALRLVPAMSVWSVRTRRAPSRHCRDARVYGHTTTAAHDNGYTPPRPTVLVIVLLIAFEMGQGRR